MVTVAHVLVSTGCSIKVASEPSCLRHCPRRRSNRIRHHVACKELHLIGTRWNRANHNFEYNADVDLRGGCSYTLPCELDATTVSIALGRGEV